MHLFTPKDKLHVSQNRQYMQLINKRTFIQPRQGQMCMNTTKNELIESFSNLLEVIMWPIPSNQSKHNRIKQLNSMTMFHTNNAINRRGGRLCHNGISTLGIRSTKQIDKQNTSNFFGALCISRTLIHYPHKQLDETQFIYFTILWLIGQFLYKYHEQ